MPNQIKLQEPIIEGSLPATNFFNGRLVTSGDMTREQDARREADRRLGRSSGEGIVEGLRVVKAATAGDEPVVKVSRGLAVNRCGQTLCLSTDTSVNLLQRFGTIEQPSKIFSNCQPITPGTYAAGFGLYLLVLSPAETSRGSAPKTSGLHNISATCNTDVILETVRFRLLAIDPFLVNDVIPASNYLRNYIAYRCFGVDKTRGLFKNPLGPAPAVYGLLDEMRGKTLSESDVPLALINWTSVGLQFVEMWAVRRSMTRRSFDDDWSVLISDRRRSETGAMMRQFADQIKSSQPENKDFRQIKAADFFRYLPPAGMLPLASQQSGAGFDLNNFFGDKKLKDLALLDGDRLRPLLNDALSHEPIDLFSDEKIQLYLVRENFDAVQAGAAGVRQISLVFAKRSLPFYGTARFDSALSKWNISHFV